jgi:four helix bundle protein
MATLNSFRELRVYQELKRLHLELHDPSLTFPKFEMYELGAQVRRSSNAAPAILAEGWGSQHTNIYLEAISRAKGELRETLHHCDVALAKQYLEEARWSEIDQAYNQCDRMLQRLHQRLSEWRDSTRNSGQVNENTAPYRAASDLPEWEVMVALSHSVTDEFPLPSSH